EPACTASAEAVDSLFAHPTCNSGGSPMTAALAPRVSIVMPCLHEAETVAVCVAKALAWLSASGTSGEVLVVDNGSTDRSAELATEAGAQVIRERRRGYGNAYLRGFAEARGDI